jgi:hypothetical protein
MKAHPLRNEMRPLKPLHPWIQPPDTFRYKVQNGDTWHTLGARNNHQFGAEQLIWINFGLNGTEARYTDQVNWYLREYVGCCESLDGGRNWAFTEKADPGYIFLPQLTYNFHPMVITGKLGLGGVAAPQYNDKNAYDSISKALDVYGMVEMGVGVSEVAVPLLLEAGMIVTGAIASIVGPAISVGAGHNDALKFKSRNFFFDGFCPTFVMNAYGWSTTLVQKFYPPLQYDPGEAVYPEKRRTFRNLYNFGLKAGLLQAGRMNSVDIRNLFVLLHKGLNDSEKQEYGTEVHTWKNGRNQAEYENKMKNYYGRLGSILKDTILKNNLQIKFS